MGKSELDRIYIRDLTARCIVGVNPDERVNLQDIVINVVLHADLRAACASDDLEDTVNYKTIKNEVLAFAEGSSCFLIERLAEEIAAICLKSPMVARAEVTVDKPSALRFARSVAVRIVRDRT